MLESTSLHVGLLRRIPPQGKIVHLYLIAGCLFLRVFRGRLRQRGLVVWSWCYQGRVRRSRRLRGSGQRTHLLLAACQVKYSHRWSQLLNKLRGRCPVLRVFVPGRTRRRALLHILCTRYLPAQGEVFHQVLLRLLCSETEGH